MKTRRFIDRWDVNDQGGSYTRLKWSSSSIFFFRGLHHRLSDIFYNDLFQHITITYCHFVFLLGSYVNVFVRRNLRNVSYTTDIICVITPFFFPIMSYISTKKTYGYVFTDSGQDIILLSFFPSSLSLLFSSLLLDYCRSVISHLDVCLFNSTRINLREKRSSSCLCYFSDYYLDENDDLHLMLDCYS